MSEIRRRSWGSWFEDHIYCRGSWVRGPVREGEAHPLAHIKGAQCHEWLRADCAALELARQEREDSIIASITNISSASLVAIPGLIFGVGTMLPEFRTGWALYSGLAGFGLALALAFLEQIASSSAYRKQADIARAYYHKQSATRSDDKSVKFVNRLRNSAILVFGMALLLSAYGLTQLRRSEDVKLSQTNTTASPATSAATFAAATSAASSASAAASTTDTRDVWRPRNTKVGTGERPTATTEAVN